MSLSLASRWAIATFVAMLLITSIIVSETYHSDRRAEENFALETLAKYRASIEKAVGARFNQVLALEAFVKSHTGDHRKDPVRFKQQFRYFSSALAASTPGIMSLQLAPDGIVTYFTNEERNAKAFGFDLFRDDRQRQQILKTVERREVFVTGPLELIQGGEAIIARKAIFTDPGTYQPEHYIRSLRASEHSDWITKIPSDFWGFAIVLIDVETLYQESLEQQLLPSGVHLALRGRHGTGEDGEVFWGSPEVFDAPLATTKILLPGGTWVLGLRNDDRSIRYLLMAVGGLLFSFIAAYAVYNRHKSIQIDLMSKARTSFLAAMSHELRTPMNGVIGMAELLKDTNLNAQQRHYLNHVIASGRTLRKLIDDILDVTKLSSDKVAIEAVPYNPRTVIQHSLMTIQAQAQDKGLLVHQQVDTDFPSNCVGDPTRVQQVLINLLGNAVKFTERGEISLHASLVSGNKPPLLQISIKDTGIGIANSQQQRIFEAFTQADETVTRIYGGSGLGMMISKNLLELMGGSIELTSDLGKGTEVVVLLPYEPSDSTDAGPDPITDEGNTPAGMDKSELKVLVVEDVDFNREIAVRLLKKLGYTADIAIDGQQALSRLDAQEYDLIFMDRHMPVMDGITATEQIRQRYADSTKPWIIALSASALDEERQQCLNAGMNDYLSKPVSAEDLAHKIEDYWQQRQQTQDSGD